MLEACWRKALVSLLALAVNLALNSAKKIFGPYLIKSRPNRQTRYLRLDATHKHEDDRSISGDIFVSLYLLYTGLTGSGCKTE